MYEEMEDEFGRERYLAEDKILLEDYYEEGDTYEFEWDIDLPYGDIDVTLKYRNP